MDVEKNEKALHFEFEFRSFDIISNKLRDGIKIDISRCSDTRSLKNKNHIIKNNFYLLKHYVYLNQTTLSIISDSALK
jgi:hypothetical protein